MKALSRPLFIAFVLATVFSASCSSCSSCNSEQAKSADAGQADASAKAEPDAAEDTHAKELAEAKKKAKVLGDQVAFDRVTKARFMTAELEGEEKKVDGPHVKRAPQPKDTGKIDVHGVNQVFANHRGALQKCYERGLKRDPMLQGKVTLTVRVGRGGATTMVKARSHAISDHAALHCMEREAKSWLFPSPSGGTVLVNKPFRFTPKN